jgi:hypothetical protein
VAFEGPLAEWNGDGTMTQRRLNPFSVAPDGVAALVGVENYL